MKNKDITSEVIAEAKEYIDGFQQRNDRYKAWTSGGKSDFVKKELEEIAESIISENDYFKSNLYVKELFSKISHNGKSLYSKAMRTIMLFSGKVIAQGYGGEDQKSFYSISENGFQLHFSIALSGKINVIAYGHSLEDREAPVKVLETIDHPDKLTSEKIQCLVLECLKYVKTTSFLFDNNL